MMSLATASAPPQPPPIARPRAPEPELPAPPPDPASAVPAQRAPDATELVVLDRPVDPAAAAPGHAPFDLLPAPAQQPSALLREESPHATVVHDRPVDSLRDHGSVHLGDHDGDPPVLPPRQVDHGPLTGPEYRIPEV